MRITKLIAVSILILIFYSSCKKSASKPDYVLLSDTNTYVIKKGYITFSTPDTSITLTAPNDKITVKRYEPSLEIDYPFNNGQLFRMNITLTNDTVQANKTYSVYFNYYDGYKNLQILSYNDPTLLTSLLTQFNTAPYLLKGSFSGNAELIHPSLPSGGGDGDVQITGQYNLELTTR